MARERLPAGQAGTSLGLRSVAGTKTTPAA